MIIGNHGTPAPDARPSKYDIIALEASMYDNVKKAAKIGLYVGVAVGTATLITAGAQALARGVFGSSEG